MRMALWIFGTIAVIGCLLLVRNTRFTPPAGGSLPLHSINTSSDQSSKIVANNRNPVAREVNDFNEVEVDSLVNLYLGESSLAGKERYAKKLALIGGDSAANALISTLTGSFSDEALGVSERKSVLLIVSWLGYISARSEVARSFLRAGLDISFWRGVRRWKSDSDEDFVDESLVCKSLIGLASGGDPFVLEEVNRLRHQPVDGSTLIVGCATSAVFQYDMIAKFGQTNFIQISTSDQLALLNEWYKTPNGNDLHTWYQSNK